MKFVRVNEIPKKRMPTRGELAEYKPLHAYFREFMKMNAKYVQVVFSPSEYCSHSSALSSIQLSITRCGLPIKVVTREKNIYLMRTDLKDE